MGFWNNPENNPLKALIVVGVIATTGLFVYSFAAGNPFGGFGRVLSKMFGFGYGYGTSYTSPTVYDHTNIPGCTSTWGTSTVTGASCSGGVYVTGITATSAKLFGIVVSTGGTPVVDRGFNYGIATGAGGIVYTTSTHETGSFGIGEFSAVLSGLTCNTTYNYRAFAQNSVAIGFEPLNRTFKTSACAPITLPSVVTTTASTTPVVTLMGNLTSMGGAPSSLVSFQYGTTTSYGTATAGVTLTSLTAFGTVVSGLSCGTIYHYRAVANNSAGTVYGMDKAFTTSACPILPLGVVTVSATDNFLTGTTTYGGTTLKGNLTGTGGASTTNVSFEVGATTAYGISVPASPKTAPGTFASSVGLTCGKTYHFRAKANNSVGTVYGADMLFNTAKCTVKTSPTTTSSTSTATSSSAVKVY